MKLNKMSGAWILGGLILSCLQGLGLARPTNQTVHPIGVSPAAVRTNFIEEARLSASEVKEVLQLARKFGIDNPTEVETFYYQPGAVKGIRVRSADRVSGRNTSFDAVCMAKDGWGNMLPEKNVQRVGRFWASADALYTTCLRQYLFKGTMIQISMGTGVDIALADKAIPLIASGSVRFDEKNDDGFIRLQMKGLGDKKPTSIHKDSRMEGVYALCFDNQWVEFRWEDGRVVITGFTYINV